MKGAVRLKSEVEAITNDSLPVAQIHGDGEGP